MRSTARRFPRAARLRVSVLAAGAAVALVATLVPNAAEAGPTATKTKGDPVTATIRIASYNAGSMVRVPRAVSDVKALMDKGADIIALQEMSSWKKRSKIQKRFVDCATCVYDAWMPVKAVPGGQPILYRSDKFTLLGTGMVQVSPDTYVGPRGAGPSTMRAKYIIWARLREISTQRQVYVLNNHAVPTVQQGNGRPNKQKKRLQLYRMHMDGLRALIDQIKTTTGGSIFVLGDLNVNYRSDRVVKDPLFPFYNMGQVGAAATFETLGIPDRGTHVLPSGFDKRIIDYGYYVQRRWVTPVAQQIVVGLHSDHRPLLVDYKLQSRGCFRHHASIC